MRIGIALIHLTLSLHTHSLSLPLSARQILAHSSFEQALSFVLANRLSNATMLPTQLFEIFYKVGCRLSVVGCRLWAVSC